MPHINNKVKWCLKKAEKELEEGDKHRGLLKITPDVALASLHIIKAEHNLKAMTEFKKIGFSDWSASAGFYCIYHCFLAILAKIGYESRNQECTFALIYTLIEEGKIGFSRELLSKISSLVSRYLRLAFNLSWAKALFLNSLTSADISSSLRFLIRSSSF